LIALISNAHRIPNECVWRALKTKDPFLSTMHADQIRGLRCSLRLQLASNILGRPGGFCGETEPDPIPNSAVKLSCADGTKPQGLEE
jgi:hypothetical protein